MNYDFFNFENTQNLCSEIFKECFLFNFRIVVGLVTLLTIVGSGYEMVLERRKIKEFRRRQISQGNNNEGDSKDELTLEKMQAIENMRIKGRKNEDGSLVEEESLFTSNVYKKILFPI